MKRYFLPVTLSALLLTAVPGMAMAQETETDPCFTLNYNATWGELFTKFTNAYKEKDFDSALAATGELEQICSRSPLLQYSIGMTYREKGDAAKALEHYILATKNIREFEVSNELETKIWFSRLEIENADSIVSRKEFDQLSDEHKTAVQEANALRAQLSRDQADLQSHLDAERQHYKTIMWTGTGIGAAGLALAITGGVLVLTKGNEINGIGLAGNDGKYSYSVELPGALRPGWALLGIGIGMTAVGAAMAGFGGYYYTHLDDNTTPALGFGPSSLDMKVSF